MTDQQIIRQCIERVSRTKYPGGGWQAEKSLRDTFAFRGDPKIAAMCAAAARRIGDWLRSK